MYTVERILREFDNPPDEDNINYRPIPEEQRTVLQTRLQILLDAETITPETECQIRPTRSWINPNTGATETEMCEKCNQPIVFFILLGKTERDDSFSSPLDTFEEKIHVCCGFRWSRQDRIKEVEGLLASRRALGEFDGEDEEFDRLLNDEDDE